MYRLFPLIIFLFSSLIFAGPVEDTLQSLIEDGIVGDDELILLIESIDGDAPKNPICDDLAATSIEHQFAQEDLDAVMGEADIGWDAVRDWANDQLDESKRVEKKRQEKREETFSVVEAGLNPSLTVSADYLTCGIDYEKKLRCWKKDNERHRFSDNAFNGKIKMVFMHTEDWIDVILEDNTHKCIRNPASGSTGNICDGLQFEEKIKFLVTNSYAKCAISMDDRVICKIKESDLAVPESLGEVKKLSGGSWGFCALTKKNMPICWGGNAASKIPEDLGAVWDIESGKSATCIYIHHGVLRCLGRYQDDYGNWSGFDKTLSIPFDAPIKFMNFGMSNRVYFLDADGKVHSLSLENMTWSDLHYLGRQVAMGKSSHYGQSTFISEKQRLVHCSGSSYRQFSGAPADHISALPDDD